jgi:hypothetical protein
MPVPLSCQPQTAFLFRFVEIVRVFSRDFCFPIYVEGRSKIVPTPDLSDYRTSAFFA